MTVGFFIVCAARLMTTVSYIMYKKGTGMPLELKMVKTILIPSKGNQ